MGSSREVPRMAIQFEFLIKMQNSMYIVRNFGWFLFSMSPDGTVSSDFEIWIGVNEYQ